MMMMKLIFVGLRLGAAFGCSAATPRTAPGTPVFTKLLAPDFKIVVHSKKEEAELPLLYAVFAAQRRKDDLLRFIHFESGEKASATILNPYWMHGDSSLTFVKENGVWKITDWMSPL